MKGDTLSLTVERGELVVPNIGDCFPVTSDTEDMTEEERRLYYQEAMRQGLGSRLIPKHFTTVGKMKVQTSLAQSYSWRLIRRVYQSCRAVDIFLVI